MLANGGYTTNLPMLAGPAALVLCLNAAGRRLNAATVSDNFQLVSAKVEHAVAYRLKDAGALRLCLRVWPSRTPACWSAARPRSSAAFWPTVPHAAPATKPAAVCVAAGRLLSGCLPLYRHPQQGPGFGRHGHGGVGCLAAPLAGTLLSALPARMMQRSAAQVGAVIPGWRDIRQLGRINVIQVTARDLFPVGCVSLAGIKPVKPEHIDTAIVYAASILSEAGPSCAMSL